MDLLMSSNGYRDNLIGLSIRYLYFRLEFESHP